MNEQPNRTFVCSVLFLDIVEYSKRSVAEQMTFKQRFNALLGQVLRNVAVNDRIVLDTGDGAAISFLGNPEDTLFAAMTLRDAIASEPASGAPSLAIRIGINLGPVRLIKDLNGQLNIIGDGINVAQRVMGFAVPGQILVSRSYFEVVSRLSPEFSQLFQYEGSRTDKHVREHEVYTVGPTSIDLKKSASEASVAADADAASGSASAIGPIKAWLRNPQATLLVLLPLAVAIVLAAGVAIRMQRNSPESQPAPQTAASLPAPPASEEQRQEPTDASGPARQDKERPAKVEPAVRAVQPVPKTAAKPPPPKKAAVDQKPAVAPPPPRAPVAATPAPETVAVPVQPPAPPPASLRLAIIPWGEVFVDGQSQGVSPPVKQITVTPGKHLIVVRNTSLPQHTQQVDLKPGEQFTIRHRFD
ncbi:MAG: hypothetical protein A3G25_19075 [Betaproteobacteria bacterium RIFCSPLOWO2_12_FULL_63_13]|nr:MAG: hypothetical protein A3H32_14805 [Betaproteobacteria bacterium RIFCSPLOWO2_02_FULL_63_19]OGA42625.1 MAG: hypothetical protein A3G25_19075 [Betaproteobacteria bacterium RIFCSPLOWO2_12_FULL_63_13]